MLKSRLPFRFHPVGRQTIRVDSLKGRDVQKGLVTASSPGLSLLSGNVTSQERLHLNK